MRAYEALARLEQGGWEEAAEEAARLLDQYRLAPIVKIPALVVLGWVRVRRGDPGSTPLLDEAPTLPLATGELQQIHRRACPPAEAAGPHGNPPQCPAYGRGASDLSPPH